MPKGDQMALAGSLKYLRLIQSRHSQPTRRKRRRLPDEAERVPGHRRRGLIRRLNNDLSSKSHCCQRGRCCVPRLNVPSQLVA